MAGASPITAGLQQLRLQQTAKSGANWFYWIAGLSAFNSMSLWFGFGFSFLAGLGVTQIVDGLGLAFGSNAVIPAVFVNLVALGLFITVGRLALRYPAVYAVGMAAYLLDAVPLVLFKDFLGAGFHLFAIVFMVKGFRAAQTLRASGMPVAASASPIGLPGDVEQDVAFVATGQEPLRLPASLQPLLTQIERHYDKWRACCEDPFGEYEAAAAQQAMEESATAFLEGAIAAGADEESVTRILTRRFPLAPGLHVLRSTG